MIEQFLKPNPEGLSKIKHIVVLMLENRSFDNMLGWLYDGKEPPGGQHFEGLRDDMWNPLDNIDGDGIPFVEQVYVRKNGEKPANGPYAQTQKRQYSENLCFPNPDPGEGYGDTNHQLFEVYNVPALYPPDPVNFGFVNNYKNAMLYGAYSFGDSPTDPRDIMACYTPKQTPVLSALAQEFCVCDHYHCSVPSQTIPNRDFVHAATSTGLVNNGPGDNCDAKTIFNQIEDAIDQGRSDLSWRIYCGEKWDKDTNKAQLFSLTQTIMTQLQDEKFQPNIQFIDDFYDAAKNNALPSYAFLEPNFSGPNQNDQHPSQDIRPGEKLIADVYNAVVNSPQWKETMLIITYDEHGGCFDHVPPPGGAVPPDGKPGTPGEEGFLFNRFGVRVPTVIVSPYVTKGQIARPEAYVPFDHSSIIATVRNCFGLDGYLTQRDENAPDLSCVLTHSRPRRDKPKVKPLAYVSDKPAEQQGNDLNQHCANTLKVVSGIEQKNGESTHQYIHRAYHQHFVKRAKPK